MVSRLRSREKEVRLSAATSPRVAIPKSLPRDVAMKDAADEFLDNEPQLKAISDLISSNPDKRLIDQANAISKATRRQQLKALAFAYAVWLKAGFNPAFRTYISRLRKEQKSSDPRITDLHLLVRDIIHYGDQTKEGRSANRGLYSRDVAAIKYLFASHIGPNSVEDLSLRPGQGVDHWARSSPVVTGKPSNSKKTASPTCSVTIQMPDVDGNTFKRKFNVSIDPAKQKIIKGIIAMLDSLNETKRTEIISEEDLLPILPNRDPVDY